MSPHTHLIRTGAGLLLAAALALLSSPASSATHTGYGWPIKPFDRQHAVRGNFGDPRMAGPKSPDRSLHFGVDISAPDGTAVYATLDGVAAIHPLHRDTVMVSGADGITHEYWHVVPSITPGEHVVAYRTVVGHVEAPWGHVHFSERIGSTYVNPLRPGALTPYRDTTRPYVHEISFERNGVPTGPRLSGSVDFVAEAGDTPAIEPPAPWAGVPVTPALVEWRLAGTSWHVAADFRDALPRVGFSSIYAAWTRENHPNVGHQLGRYRFVLARGLDTRTLPNGRYRLVVLVRDTAGNQSEASRPFTVENGV